jgi:hypothetical protein
MLAKRVIFWFELAGVVCRQSLVDKMDCLQRTFLSSDLTQTCIAWQFDMYHGINQVLFSHSRQLPNFEF